MGDNTARHTDTLMKLPGLKDESGLTIYPTRSKNLRKGVGKLAESTSPTPSTLTTSSLGEIAERFKMSPSRLLAIHLAILSAVDVTLRVVEKLPGVNS